MDIPALAGLPERILSQCGLITGVLMVAIVWLALQLAKTRGGWETDRAAMMKLYESQITANENLAVSHAKLEGMFAALQRVPTDPSFPLVNIRK